MRTLTVSLCTLLIAACAQDMSRPDTRMHQDSPYATGMTAAKANQAQRDPLPTASLPAGIYPASQEMLPTTAGSIFLHNLDASIAALIAAGAEQPDSRLVSKLAGLLYHRFQVLGDLDDADRALALMESVKNPGAAELRLRASLRSGLHRFDAALADLAMAAKLDKPRASDDRARRAIAIATGKYDQIEDLIEDANKPSGKFVESILRGNIAVYKGDLDQATVQFLGAQQAIHDTAPYPLAWLYAQQGIALLRFGRCEAALPFFLAAENRVPGYALAMDHRAECLLRLQRLGEARSLYQKLIDQTGNPIFLGGLALVEAEAGNQQLAEQLHKRTRAAWTELLAREPKAWSEHAAEYYLAIGQEQDALRLARINLANRRDVLSLILMARAAHANGKDQRACEALAEVMASPLRPPALQTHAADLPHCAATRDNIAGT